MKILGANWRTSISGFLSNLCALTISLIIAISENPEAFSNLWVPITKQGQAIAIVSFLAFLFKTVRDFNAKDRQVMGGKILQNEQGENVGRAPESEKIASL